MLYDYIVVSLEASGSINIAYREVDKQKVCSEVGDLYVPSRIQLIQGLLLSASRGFLLVQRTADMFCHIDIGKIKSSVTGF